MDSIFSQEDRKHMDKKPTLYAYKTASVAKTFLMRPMRAFTLICNEEKKSFMYQNNLSTF